MQHDEFQAMIDNFITKLFPCALLFIRHFYQVFDSAVSQKRSVSLEWEEDF